MNFDNSSKVQKNRFRVLHRDGFKCAYCGISSEASELEVDHIIPSSKGGSDHLDNLITACIPCNQSKSDFQMLPEYVEALTKLAKKRNLMSCQDSNKGKIPVTIRGVNYESCTQAGKALGISGKSVMQARKRGQAYLDKCGLNKQMQAAGQKGADNRKKQVTIDGVVYESASDYARDNDICIHTAYSHAKKGTAKALKRIMGVNSTVDGIHFEFMRDVQDYYKVSQSTAAKYIKHGTSEPLKVTNKPVKYAGESFESQSALALYLGLCTSTVSEAVRQGRVEGLGNGVGNSTHQNKKILWGSNMYQTANELAVKLGVSISSIYSSIQYGSRDGQAIRYIK